jgi:hypothetical protein
MYTVVVGIRTLYEIRMSRMYIPPTNQPDPKKRQTHANPMQRSYSTETEMQGHHQNVAIIQIECNNSTASQGKCFRNMTGQTMLARIGKAMR